MYYWGEYEELVHDSYVRPGATDTQSQIEKLNTDIQVGEAAGKKVAPGVYAHLGYLYATQGKENQSKTAFAKEQLLFPESSVFINGLLRRAVQQKETP